mmetsp:Transcript_35627/g.107355  ORF Transcript_35627/g.107355 Transcript_35627/m.107355 type:complete len:319 (-) Transcript_35627:454-1410(-)
MAVPFEHWPQLVDLVDRHARLEHRRNDAEAVEVLLVGEARALLVRVLCEVLSHELLDEGVVLGDLDVAHELLLVRLRPAVSLERAEDVLERRLARGAEELARRRLDQAAVGELGKALGDRDVRLLCAGDAASAAGRKRAARLGHGLDAPLGLAYLDGSVLLHRAPALHRSELGHPIARRGLAGAGASRTVRPRRPGALREERARAWGRRRRVAARRARRRRNQARRGLGNRRERGGRDPSLLGDRRAAAAALTAVPLGGKLKENLVGRERARLSELQDPAPAQKLGGRARADTDLRLGDLQLDSLVVVLLVLAAATRR